MKKKRNYLCICAGGNVRSVAVAYLVKYKYQHNAIAAGVDFFGDEEFVANLMSYAQHIIVVSEEIEIRLKRFLDLYHTRYIPITRIDIGEDKWGPQLGPYNNELMNLAEDLIDKSGLFSPKRS